MTNQNTEDHPPIQGVFSTMETRKVGTGTTLRKTKLKQYWLVRQIDEETAEVQPINENLIPIGKKRAVDVSTVLERFTPEPDFYITQPSFLPESSDSQLDLDDAPPPPEPEEGLPGLKVEIEGFEMSGSAEEIETNARASFGLGLTYLKRGNVDKAEEIFTRLAEMDAAFVPEHKHMFNDFGVSLRKQSLFDTALKHYLRALELSGEDENLLHNIARAYFEKEDMENCVKYLEKSLEVNPNLKESHQFLRFLEKKDRKKDRKKSKGQSSAPLSFDF